MLILTLIKDQVETNLTCSKMFPGRSLFGFPRNGERLEELLTPDVESVAALRPELKDVVAVFRYVEFAVILDGKLFVALPRFQADETRSQIAGRDDGLILEFRDSLPIALVVAVTDLRHIGRVEVLRAL